MKGCSPLFTYMFITHFLSELEEEKKPINHCMNIPVTSAPRRWIPAIEDHAKINVDAAVFRGVGAAAAVCRKNDGHYLGYSVLVTRGLVDPPTPETMACREGLSLAEDLGLQNIVLASDCQEVVKHIKDKSGGNYGIVVKEIISWQSSFNSCCFKFEFRASNFEPHKLARHAVKLVHGATSGWGYHMILV